jgi:thioredoxin-related protein
MLRGVFMKRIFYFIILIVVSISFASCKSDSGTKVKIDSNIATAEIDTTMPEPFDKQPEESGGG